MQQYSHAVFLAFGLSLIVFGIMTAKDSKIATLTAPKGQMIGNAYLAGILYQRYQSLLRVLLGDLTIDQVARKIYDVLLTVGSGKTVKAEKLKYDQTVEIYTTGPTV